MRTDKYHKSGYCWVNYSIQIFNPPYLLCCQVQPDIVSGYCKVMRPGAFGVASHSDPLKRYRKLMSLSSVPEWKTYGLKEVSHRSYPESLMQLTLSLSS